MSQAVRQFLHSLRDNHENELITEQWDNLSFEEQVEAEEMAECSETLETDVPCLPSYDLDEILASS